MQELKYYEIKSFDGCTLYDYWDLKNHPLYISVDKTIAIPYMRFDEQYFDKSTKVDSLTAVRRFLDKVPWTAEPKYRKHITKVIQSIINIPWTPLY